MVRAFQVSLIFSKELVIRLFVFYLFFHCCYTLANYTYHDHILSQWIHDIIAKIRSLMETLIRLLFPIFNDLILYNQLELFQTLSPLNKFLPVTLRKVCLLCYFFGHLITDPALRVLRDVV